MIKPRFHKRGFFIFVSMKNILYLTISFSLFLMSCSESKKEDASNDPESEPAFCDCVNKDYHKDGDKEKCEKLEAELKEKLKSASKEEKGDILLKIQDCKVQGQYDND